MVVDVVDHAEEVGVEDLVVQAGAGGGVDMVVVAEAVVMAEVGEAAAMAAGAVVMGECLQRVIPKAADTELHSWQRFLNEPRHLRSASYEDRCADAISRDVRGTAG